MIQLFLALRLHSILLPTKNIPRKGTNIISDPYGDIYLSFRQLLHNTLIHKHDKESINTSHKQHRCPR